MPCAAAAHGLISFRWASVEPLRIKKHERAIRGLFVAAAWAAAAVVLIAAVTMINHRPAQTHAPSSARILAGADQLTNPQPLTIGRANALLAQAPSVKAAVDSLAFPPQTTRAPKGTRSVLATLGEENIKEKMKL